MPEEFQTFDFNKYLEEEIKDPFGYNEEISSKWAAHDTAMQVREILEAMRKAKIKVVWEKEEDGTTNDEV